MLTLRGSLTPGARRQYAEMLAGGLEREDALAARDRAAVRAPRGVVDDRGARDHPPEGAPRPLPDGHRATSGGSSATRSASTSPSTSRSCRRRDFPDPDAFAALLCDWCLRVGAARPGARVARRTLAAAAASVRCTARCSTAARGRRRLRHRDPGSGRGLLPPRARRACSTRFAPLELAEIERIDALPADRRARQHRGPGRRRSGLLARAARARSPVQEARLA